MPSLRRRTSPAATPPEQPPTRLAGLRPIAHDPDERPCAEDLQGTLSPFTIPVPVPRFLKPRREWGRRT